MDKDAKILFFHIGQSLYLQYVLYQAKFSSPNSDVILLGENTKFRGIENAPLDNFSNTERIRIFKENYVHMSSNSQEFELNCWLRWFYMFEYMRRNRIHSVFHFDSDVSLYSSIETIVQSYSHLISDCAFMIPYQDSNLLQWLASGHVSYWTATMLGEFCDFIIDSFCKDKYLRLYKDKWNWHISTGRPGGICDMTTLYFFWLERQSLITNLAINYDGNVFDDNVNCSSNHKEDEYVIHQGIKKIKFINKKPMFISKKTGEFVYAHAIHFQGNAKVFIPRYYTGMVFKGKVPSDMFFYYKRWEWRLRKSLSRSRGIKKVFLWIRRFISGLSQFCGR